MQDNFYLPIINTKKKFYTIFANILLFINFIFYSLVKFNIYHFGNCTSVFRCLVLPNAILLVFIFRLFYIFKLKKLHFTSLHFGLLASVCWLSLNSWAIALIILLLSVLEYFVNKDLLFVINSTGIKLNSLPPRHYQWQHLNNVLLKEGIFTIDTKDNKIFQIDVSDTVIPYTEEDFNAFVAKQLN